MDASQNGTKTNTFKAKQNDHLLIIDRESCAAVLRAGHLLGISPGGMYEAQMGDNMYQVMWKARDGFAQVVKEAGGSIPIIPVFTQNIREAYKSFNFGITRPIWAWLYQVTRMPLGKTEKNGNIISQVPVYTFSM